MCRQMLVFDESPTKALQIQLRTFLPCAEPNLRRRGSASTLMSQPRLPWGAALGTSSTPHNRREVSR